MHKIFILAYGDINVHELHSDEFREKRRTLFVSTCNIIMFHLDVYVFVLTIYTLNRNNDDKTSLTFKHLARQFRYILSLDKTLN